MTVFAVTLLIALLALVSWVYVQLIRRLTAIQDEITLLKQIPMMPDRSPEPESPHSWVSTDALQAAQEKSQTKRMAKIANAVKWGG